MAKIAVAPLVGAWIEILFSDVSRMIFDVAPLVGAWIEIVTVSPKTANANGRSPRGSVD